MWKKLVFIFLLCLAAVYSDDNIFDKCGDRLQCVEDEMIKYVDQLDSEPAVSFLGDYVVMEKIQKGGEIETFRKEENFIERCIRYLSSRELKVRIPSSEARSLETDGRSSKLKKIILPLLVLLKLKAAIIVPAVLSIIALVAFKGLGAGLIALAISGATGLKSLLEAHHHGSKLTYEVVPQIASPHWSRAGFEAVQAAGGYHSLANL